MGIELFMVSYGPFGLDQPRFVGPASLPPVPVEPQEMVIPPGPMVDIPVLVPEQVASMDPVDRPEFGIGLNNDCPAGYRSQPYSQKHIECCHVSELGE